MTFYALYSRFFKVAVVLLSLALGFYLGFLIFSRPSINATSSKSLRIGGNQFTSPLLLGDVENNKDSTELSDLSKQVQSIISKAQSDGSLASASVYYRTLQGGEQINVNGDEKYFPASLTKVPLMMAYLKMGESDPNLLTTRGEIQFNQDYNAGQEIKPEQAPVSGREYTINDLLKMMIESSDNDSFNLLINKPGAQDELKQLFADFQLYYPFDDRVSNIITPRDFSRFLRVLYNATYLSVNDSELALSLMSKSEFRDGIVAGVPNGVVVAHKFGLNTDVGTSGTVALSRQLHDCGIVYYPARPYVLCIMTKSTADLPKIEAVIKKISSTIYDATTKSN